MTKDHYEILGVDRSADFSALKAAYRRKAREHHPDMGGDAEAFAALNLAFDTLSDSDRRAYYDASGKSELPPDPIEIRARVLLHDLIVQALDHPDATGRYTRDLVATVAGLLDEGERRIPVIAAQMRDRLGSLERLAPRVSGAVLAGNIAQHIRTLESKLIALENERPAIDAARRMLKRCRHTPELDLETTYAPQFRR